MIGDQFVTPRQARNHDDRKRGAFVQGLQARVIRLERLIDRRDDQLEIDVGVRCLEGFNPRRDGLRDDHVTGAFRA